MCKYCEKKKFSKISAGKEMEVDYNPKIVENGLRMNIYMGLNKYPALLFNDNDGNFAGYTLIKYCPICGRKLAKEC